MGLVLPVGGSVRGALRPPMVEMNANNLWSVRRQVGLDVLDHVIRDVALGRDSSGRVNEKKLRDPPNVVQRGDATAFVGSPRPRVGREWYPAEMVYRVGRRALLLRASPNAPLGWGRCVAANRIESLRSSVSRDSRYCTSILRLVRRVAQSSMANATRTPVTMTTNSVSNRSAVCRVIVAMVLRC